MNTKQLNTFVKDEIHSTNTRGMYVETIDDYIQTHAVYGIQNIEQLEKIKAALKNLGANKFRKVKVKHSGMLILCFNNTNMHLS